MNLDHFSREISFSIFFNKIRPNTPEQIKQELSDLDRLITDISVAMPDHAPRWYINHGTSLELITNIDQLAGTRKGDSNDLNSYLLCNEFDYVDDLTPHKAISLTLGAIDLSFEIADRRSLGSKSADYVLEVSKLMLKHFNGRYFTVYPYPFFEKRIFEHRLPCGWLTFVPKVLTKEDIPEAEELIAIDTLKNKGTLIVSTMQDFMGTESELVHRANLIAVRLVDMDLLPLASDPSVFLEDEN